MEGLIERRRREKTKLPGERGWRWAFEPESILAVEFCLFVEGRDVPVTRTYQQSDCYLRFSRRVPAKARARPTSKAVETPLRASNRVPTPVKRLGAEGEATIDSPSKKQRTDSPRRVPPTSGSSTVTVTRAISSPASVATPTRVSIHVSTSGFFSS